MISINHNILAIEVNAGLNRHYSSLAASTQKLSTGLRINGAADDAAGLAIRELQRAEIAALDQGVRNANDAISMLQVFDGALSVIDEKLIRMKELAEQAATGTYDSTQRLMIDSEFQAMGAEIDRIARATDFNGIKLLDGSWAAAAAPDAGGGAALPFEVEVTANWGGLSGGNQAALVAGITNGEALGAGTHVISLTNLSYHRIAGSNNWLNIYGADTTGTVEYYHMERDGRTPTNEWHVTTPAGRGVDMDATTSQGSMTIGGDTINVRITDAAGNTLNHYGSDFTMNNVKITAGNNEYGVTSGNSLIKGSSSPGNPALASNGTQLSIHFDLGNGNTIDQTLTGINKPANVSFTIKVTDPNQKSDTPVPEDRVKIHFGAMNDPSEDYYYIFKNDATLNGLGLDGVKVQTQNEGQEALVKIGDAITVKDKIRADYGALQNRLENTVTANLTQIENLQASEARISDADIAAEMTAFVRAQVLTNSAVAMLAQANSMPQMVMRLIEA